MHNSEIYSYITEGIGEDILPANVNFDLIDHFEKVTDKEGAVLTRRLALEEGIFAELVVLGKGETGSDQGRQQNKVFRIHEHGGIKNLNRKSI